MWHRLRAQNVENQIYAVWVLVSQLHAQALPPLWVSSLFKPLHWPTHWTSVLLLLTYIQIWYYLPIITVYLTQMNVFCTLGSKSFRPIPLESKWIIRPPRTLWRPIGKSQSLMYHICSSFRLGTFLIFTMEMTNKNRSPQSVSSCLGSSYPPRRSAWGNGVSSLPETA